MTRPPDDAVKALSFLLEDERAALLSGNLDVLEQILPEKMDLVDSLNARPGNDPALLTELQSRIARNQSLLQSAMDGIRSVSDHVTAVRSVQSTLTVYDDTGRTKRHHSQAPAKLERRA